MRSCVWLLFCWIVSGSARMNSCRLNSWCFVMARGKSAVATDAGDSDKPRFDEFIVIYLIKRLVYDKCLWEEDSPTGTLMSLVWEKEKKWRCHGEKKKLDCDYWQCQWDLVPILIVLPAVNHSSISNWGISRLEAHEFWFQIRNPNPCLLQQLSIVTSHKHPYTLTSALSSLLSVVSTKLVMHSPWLLLLPRELASY